ncbi:unnamed protein product [Leptosia nina]|uniref:Guanine nucleotide exchange factor DBS n=1 Tax=Leptosia nina TaxID=320188 RepID=A0AAV1J4Y7_9NEOP
MTEVGETANRVDGLIQEVTDFQKLCTCDLDAASCVIVEGEKLMQDPLSSVDHIESKCEELRRTSALLIDKIHKRNLLLTKARELMDRIDKANEWCTTGVEILAGEGGLIAVDKLLEDAKSFGLTSPDEFRDMLMQSATQETRALVTQVSQRVEDVWLMVTVKRATLQRAAAKPARPVQSVPPQSAAIQPSTDKMETSGGSESSGGEDAEARRSRRGHVLAELLQTERIYVQEMGSILNVNISSATYIYDVVNTQPTLRGRPTQWNRCDATHSPSALRCRLSVASCFTCICIMKYGKYDIHKSSADLSIGTSYSWYYRKNDSTTRKKKRLTRTASDSTLFSDYANQIALFDKTKNRRKKTVTDNLGCRIKCQRKNLKPVDVKPFTGNFFYGKLLPGYEHAPKTEEKIVYLPDSDVVTVSEDNTAESLTSGATVVDLPEIVKNPIYGCKEREVHIPTPEDQTDSTISKDSQLKSNSCTELRNTMDSNTTNDVFTNILKDYKRIMKEWNTTIMDHYYTGSHSKRSTMCSKSNTESYVRSLHSTLSYRKKGGKSSNNHRHSYNYQCKRYRGHRPKKSASLRDQTLSNWSTTLRNIKSIFQKNGQDSSSHRDCLEAIYEDYDKRLQQWCDTITEYTSSLDSGYKEEIEKPENQHVLPSGLLGQADVLFGNLHELFTFHQEIFLKDLEKSISATELVALCFVEKRETFFRLYSYYCQNIPRSERLRETLVDTHLFLQACQQRLGHKLPLAAYLLKPVQRITKYQLLLKDLLRYSECGSMSAGLQQALDCMLVVLKCVNDSMHQIAITGVPVDLSQQGELLLQGSFLVASENKRDLRLRIRPRRRHIFLYEKAMLFCKPAAKNSHNKATYHFKHDLQMSQIGLTESVKGDPRKFEVWRQGRAEVHTITAPTADVKRSWVERIKRVLLDQLKELKGERVRQYAQHHRTLIQTSSWDLGPQKERPPAPSSNPSRTASCDNHDEPCWSTDPSEDEEDEPEHTPVTEAVGLNGTIHRMVQFFSVSGSTQANSTFYVSQY